MKSWIGFFVFSPKLWVGSTPNNESTIKTSQIEPFRNSLFSSTNILAGYGENWKKRGGSNFFQLVPMLKNEKKIFLFSMMSLYPVLFSINSRLQKCNLFACIPRMNNSRLIKHTMSISFGQSGLRTKGFRRPSINYVTGEKRSEEVRQLVRGEKWVKIMWHHTVQH